MSQEPTYPSFKLAESHSLGNSDYQFFTEYDLEAAEDRLEMALIELLGRFPDSESRDPNYWTCEAITESYEVDHIEDVLTVQLLQTFHHIISHALKPHNDPADVNYLPQILTSILGPERRP